MKKGLTLLALVAAFAISDAKATCEGNHKKGCQKQTHKKSRKRKAYNKDKKHASTCFKKSIPEKDRIQKVRFHNRTDCKIEILEGEWEGVEKGTSDRIDVYSPKGNVFVWYKGKVHMLKMPKGKNIEIKPKGNAGLEAAKPERK